MLPTTAQTKPQAGEVVAVGEGKTVGERKVEISLKVTFLWKLEGSFFRMVLWML